MEYVGFAVKSVNRTRRVFRDLFGLESRAGEADPLSGIDQSAWIPFPNECYLYVMQSSHEKSSVYQYISKKGPGLERIGLLTDDLEQVCERIRGAGVPLENDAVVRTAAGDRLVVPARNVSGITVEVIQPRDDLFAFERLPNRAGVLGLQHIGVAVQNLEETANQFQQLFDLEMRDVRTDQHGGQFTDARGPGLEHLCIEVRDIREAVVRVTGRGIPIFDHKIFTNREDGFEAFVYPEHTTGVTIEIIEPYPTSRGYRPQK
jgi:catechol 2,3-dioxygenase-like lactoylglutathione lyase family enzyme